MQSKYSRQMVGKLELTFPLLLDPGNRVADLFGLRHVMPEQLRELYNTFGIGLPRFNGDESWSLPMPARYVIDRHGTVAYRSVSADYTQRPDIEETLAAVQNLTQEQG